MKARFWTLILAVLSCFALVTGLVACGEIDGTVSSGGNNVQTQPSDDDSQKEEEHTAHTFTVDNVCSCGERWIFTDGLQYNYDADTDSMIVVGIGSATGSIILPYGYDGKFVKSVGESAFEKVKNLTGITFPGSVTTVGAKAFKNSGLTSIKFAEGLEKIGKQAFYGCNDVKSLAIPRTLTSSGEEAFYGCRGITRVDITDLESWCKISFGPAAGNPCFHAHYLYLNGDLLTNANIPEGIGGINNYAFTGCYEIKRVTIPNSVTVIGSQAFYDNRALKTVILGRGVKNCQSDAFGGWNSIEAVYYRGTPAQWDQISISSSGNSSLTGVPHYYYSALEPTAAQWQETENWWHYVADIPTPWTKED